MTGSYDRGDSHFDTAGSWERACRHISLFLWWAAERGLTSTDINAIEVAASPTEYFIANCDTKLREEDFNAEGNRFAAARYGLYLEDLSIYALTLGVSDYEIPENTVTKNYFFGLLDARLAEFRGTPSASAAAVLARAAKARHAAGSGQRHWRAPILWALFGAGVVGMVSGLATENAILLMVGAVVATVAALTGVLRLGA